MAGRRYKPALFELVSKGPIKPDKKGSLGTPTWFYGGKSKVAGSVYEQVAGPATQADTAGPATQADVAHRGNAVGPAGASAQGGATETTRTELLPQRRLQHSTASAIRLVGRRLEFSLAYWAVALVALGLVLSVLVSYRLGEHSQGGLQQEAKVSSVDAGASERLREVARSPVRRDVFPQRPAAGKRTNESSRAALASVARVQTAKPTQPVQSQPVRGSASSALPIRSGLCLIMVTHDSARELRPVQEYFNRRGIPARIARFGSRYVLVSQYTVDGSKDAAAIEFKNRVAQLGLHYNAERPKGAVSFTSATFRSAYWVNGSRIKGLTD